MGYEAQLITGLGEIVRVHPFFSSGIARSDLVEDNDGNLFLGNNRAELYITYNYSNLLVQHLGSEGIRGLNGKRAGDTIMDINSAVLQLGTERDANYFKATPGNVGNTLSTLLEWAILNPDATWRILH